MDSQQLKRVIEAALLAAGRPLSLDDLQALFTSRGSEPTKQELRVAIDELQADCTARAIEIREVASGFRAQVRADLAPWLARLWEERPPRYSRALMETLAIIAYRQPVTRGEIEDIRGVSVTTNIIRTMLDRGWIREVGHRDVPGRPAMFGTTREFLDYFGLRKLDDLPQLTALTDLESLRIQLELPGGDNAVEASGMVLPTPVGRDFDTAPELPEADDEIATDLPLAANVVPLKAH